MGMRFQRLWHDERGTTVIEYALIAVLISVFALFSIQHIGQTIDGTFYGPIADHLDVSP